MVLFKIVLILGLMFLFFQDLRERKVYWFMFPILAICSGLLLYDEIVPEIFVSTVFINIVFVTLLILVVYSYSKLKLRQPISETFGLGDGLMFVALTFTFSSISFIILFVFSLVFALSLHLLLKKKSKFSTVPLAGYMGLFFAISYVSHWLGLLPSVYMI